MAIDPTKWYWVAGNKADVVFSGPAAAYVAESDAGYVAFLAAGNTATRILTDGELADVLTQRQMPPAMIRAAAWTDWGNVPPSDRMATALAGGLQITSTGTPALDATYHAAGVRWQLMRDEAQYAATFTAFSGGLSTLTWVAISGDVEFSSIAHFLAVTRAIGDYQTGWQLYVDGRAGDPPAGAITIA